MAMSAYEEYLLSRDGGGVVAPTAVAPPPAYDETAAVAAPPAYEPPAAEQTGSASTPVPGSFASAPSPWDSEQAIVEFVVDGVVKRYRIMQ